MMEPHYQALSSNDARQRSIRVKKSILASIISVVVILSAWACFRGFSTPNNLERVLVQRISGNAPTGLTTINRMSRKLPTLVRSSNQPFSVGSTVAEMASSEPVSSDTPEKLRIKLRSYSKDHLKEAVDMIQSTTTSTGSTCSGVVMLPTRRRIYCVLRSPHVNKDSREHFEIRTHQRLLDVTDLSPETVDALMTLDLPSGVDVNIRV
uniref:Ribosomal protein rpS10 n=1 Tax=Bigelowiella natans TaxID=227086 RepID=Q7XYN4_BIGNA|nr:ribosomal protein rpS10 [Bigelowiella natans]|mmetsp:Transcript_11108/g.15430  ORF Transcript_11108/g.15430 Transcript_11108/m.15430 type:complete len:208 (+) Transcript_11108:23-646(+)|eukprot:jgi/Bigna1/53917/estExt_Genewise1Plus.C_260054